MKGFTIGQIARRSRVNIETLRYYERRGLLPNPPRRESGYRNYPPEAIERIRFIKHAQTVGFTLKEIKELLSLRVDPKTTCSEIKKRAEMKISEVEGKIRALQTMKSALVRLKGSCKGRGPSSDCPILDALESGGEGLE